MPDKDGNTTPADLTSGSDEFRDLTNKAIGALFEGKLTYDKTYGHVAYGCGVCCGYEWTHVWYNPLDVPLSLLADDGVDATDSCSLQLIDVSDSFYYNWTTANNAIATVDYKGTHTGVSVGSTTSATKGQLQIYNGSKYSCPIMNRCPGGGANVQVPTSLKVLSSKVISDSAAISAGGAGCSTSQTYSMNIAIEYQVLDQNGAPLASNQMEPQEKDLNLIVNGKNYGSDINWADIGGGNGYPGTSKFTDANGQYLDAPLGTCANSAVTQTDTQIVSILLNGKRYPVSVDPNAALRTNNWVTKTGPAGKGSITNGSDITQSK